MTFGTATTSSKRQLRYNDNNYDTLQISHNRTQSDHKQTSIFEKVENWKCAQYAHFRTIRLFWVQTKFKDQLHRIVTSTYSYTLGSVTILVVENGYETYCTTQPLLYFYCVAYYQVAFRQN